MATAPVTKQKKTQTGHRFVEWCQKRGYQEFTPTNIINYLAERNEAHKDVLAEKTHITTLIATSTGIDLSQDRLFIAAAQGIRAANPKQPKYSSMWDLEILWQRLKTPLYPKKPDIDARTRANILIRLATAG